MRRDIFDFTCKLLPRLMGVVLKVRLEFTDHHL